MAAVLIWASVAAADEEESEGSAQSPQSDAVSLVDDRFQIMRPTGWNVVEPGEGAVAVFRSAADDRAQIEVRVSDSVSERRWERYWRTFDTDLQESGLELDRPRARTVHGGQRGFRYEYVFDVDDDTYRLSVWHTHERDRAWVFTAFYRDDRREVHERTFEELLDSMEW